MKKFIGYVLMSSPIICFCAWQIYLGKLGQVLVTLALTGIIAGVVWVGANLVHPK